MKQRLAGRVLSICKTPAGDTGTISTQEPASLIDSERLTERIASWTEDRSKQEQGFASKKHRSAHLMNSPRTDKAMTTYYRPHAKPLNTLNKLNKSGSSKLAFQSADASLPYVAAYGLLDHCPNACLHSKQRNPNECNILLLQLAFAGHLLAVDLLPQLQYCAVCVVAVKAPVWQSNCEHNNR